jgi:hypothetical protein
MNIGGKKKEVNSLPDYTKKIGLFEAKVIAVNPSAEEYKEMLGTELKEDSKAVEYLGTNQDGNTTLRLDVWLEEVKNKDKFKVTFFLEDKEKENKDQTKKQYINAVGVCSWADDPNNLPKWFADREYRVSYVGEEELYGFMRTWLGNLDYRDAETTLQLDWNKMMKGNVRDIKSQVDGEWCTNVVSLATIKTVIKDDETKEYQNIYNKGFLPAYSIKQFRLVDYTNDRILQNLRSKASRDLKPHERFVMNVTGEYGCRDYFKLKDLEDYTSGDNLVASDKTLAEDDADF